MIIRGVAERVYLQRYFLYELPKIISLIYLEAWQMVMQLFLPLCSISLDLFPKQSSPMSEYSGVGDARLHQSDLFFINENINISRFLYEVLYLLSFCGLFACLCFPLAAARNKFLISLNWKWPTHNLLYEKICCKSQSYWKILLHFFFVFLSFCFVKAQNSSNQISEARPGGIFVAVWQRQWWRGSECSEVWKAAHIFI